MLMLANPGTVFFGCLAVVVGELSRFFLRAFGCFVDERGPSTASLVASNQSLWFFLAKVKILLNVDLDILTKIALRGTLALQSSMATLFSTLRRLWLSLHTWLRETSKCDPCSFLKFIIKMGFQCLGW